MLFKESIFSCIELLHTVGITDSQYPLIESEIHDQGRRCDTKVVDDVLWYLVLLVLSKVSNCFLEFEEVAYEGDWELSRGDSLSFVMKVLDVHEEDFLVEKV